MDGVRILLISTYELGHQPLHVASPAAKLTASGHEVRAMDLSVEGFDPDRIAWSELIGISVPMHTAMRLAVETVARIRSIDPALPIALYGLYAGMSPGLGVDAMLVGEYEDDLVEWASRIPGNQLLSTDVGRDEFAVPDRSILPSLASYAHLEVGADHRQVGYVEASHGCRHRCRHCPIPTVYDGRYRIVGEDVVVDDAMQQIDAGARHITFGDPDFFNGPAHSMRVLEAIHRRAPEVGFDVTIKVEHLLNRRDLLARMRRLGVVFVVSAFESADDRTLDLLDKGHTVADMSVAVGLCREAGLDLHPSWMPFVPWTTPLDVVEIFRFVAAHDLMSVTDPVQMSIRLLVPPGSLVLDVPEVAPVMGPIDESALTHRWEALDPAADALQRRLAAIAERAASSGEDPMGVLVEQWRASLEFAGLPIEEAQIPHGATAGRPRMTEPWFC